MITDTIAPHDLLMTRLMAWRSPVRFLEITDCLGLYIFVCVCVFVKFGVRIRISGRVRVRITIRPRIWGTVLGNALQVDTMSSQLLHFVQIHACD